MRQNQVLKMLERRIRQGEYTYEGLPAERTLAEEVGVSRVTVRRAIQRLEGSGLVKRLPNRRLVVATDAEPGAHQARVAFLSPAMKSGIASADQQQWLAAVDAAADQNSATVRAHRYLHWDDPVVTATLKEFPAVFLVPSPEPLPPQIERLLQDKQHLTILSADFSHLGKPSIQLFPPVHIQRLLDHLHGLGHRRIDCFNAQGMDAVIQGRIDQWRGWCRIHGVDGELISVPWEPCENVFEVATSGACQKLGRLHRETTAVFCTTLPAAMGAVRTMHDRGRDIGRDISICTVDGEGLAESLIPSITCLKRTDVVPHLATCLRWMLDGADRDDWAGPLLMQPSDIPLFVGESTGPAPR